MSFSNEMRDFLGSYIQMRELGGKNEDRQMKREQMGLDEEYRQAMLELQREQVDIQRESARRSGAGNSVAMARLGLDRERFDWDRQQAETERLRNEALARAENLAADAQTQALPTTPTATPPVVDDFMPNDEFRDGFNKGGMVKPAYQAGGLIYGESGERFRQNALPPGAVASSAPQNNGLPPGAVQSAMSTPVQPTAPAPQPSALPTGMQPMQQDSAAGRQPPAMPQTPAEPDADVKVVNASKVIVNRAATAADAVARSFETSTDWPRSAVGEGSEAPPADSSGVDMVTNEGAMTPQEYQEIIDMIDPNGLIPAHLQSAAALAEAYTLFQERGELGKAENIAKQILVTQKQMSQTLGSLAMTAMEGGDLQSTARLLGDAVNRFPSGHEIIFDQNDMRGLTYTVRNEGEVVDQGVLNTTQTWELAAGVANGSAFLNQVAQFAQGRTQPAPAATPQQAVEVANTAYVDYMRLSDQLMDLDPNRDAEQYGQLYSQAEQMRGAYQEAVNKAVEAGVPMAQIEQRNRFALDTALPPNPNAATPEGNQPPIVARPTTRAEYDALPSGTPYIDPQGQTRTKP